MDKIKLDDFLNYNYLSGLKATGDGVFFTISRAKKDKLGYESNFYTLRGGEPRPLTCDGKASYGVPYKGKFYFLAKRTEDEKKDENKLKSTIYCLPLDGGEAAPLLEVDGSVSKFDPLGKDKFIGLITVDKRLEGLTGEEKVKKAKEIENSRGLCI